MKTKTVPKNLKGSTKSGARWGVILAGGDGTRLLPLTRRISGDDRPKQFCTLMDGETLLKLYSSIRLSGFSHDVLSVQPEHLAVLRADGLGWSDLGEPGRVLSVLERKGVRTELGAQIDRPDQRVQVCKGAAG